MAPRPARPRAPPPAARGPRRRGPLRLAAQAAPAAPAARRAARAAAGPPPACWCTRRSRSSGRWSTQSCTCLRARAHAQSPPYPNPARLTALRRALAPRAASGAPAAGWAQSAAHVPARRHEHAREAGRRRRTGAGRSGRRRAPQLLLSCCRNAQKGVPDAEVHRVDWPWHVNVQRPLMHDVNALGSVGHTFPHVPLRARRSEPVRAAAGLTGWSH